MDNIKTDLVTLEFAAWEARQSLEALVDRMNGLVDREVYDALSNLRILEASLKHLVANPR